MGFVLITVIYANKVIGLGCSLSALAAILKQVGQIAEWAYDPRKFSRRPPPRYRSRPDRYALKPQQLFWFYCI